MNWKYVLISKIYVCLIFSLNFIKKNVTFFVRKKIQRNIYYRTFLWVIITFSDHIGTDKVLRDDIISI